MKHLPSYLDTENRTPLTLDQANIQIIALDPNKKFDSTKWHTVDALKRAALPAAGAILVLKLLGQSQDLHDKCSLGLIMFLTGVIRTPADATIWAWTLYRWDMLGKHRFLTLEKLVFEVIPDGLPSDEDYARVWSAQKRKDGSNILDSVWNLNSGAD